MATRQAIFNRGERQRRMAAGLCVQCGGSRGAGHARCRACNVANRERERLRKKRERAKGKGR